jgi:hypothetical protein
MTEAESSNESPAAAVGFGPNRGGDFSQEDYHHPAAGWGVASLPESLKGQLPEPKDEVAAFGKLEKSGRGYTLAVTRLVVGQDQIKSLAAVQGSRPGDNLGHDAQPTTNP